MSWVFQVVNDIQGFEDWELTLQLEVAQALHSQ